MPDEIDLLRLFRGDTPGPDEAAWERARAAVALAAEARSRETPLSATPRSVAEPAVTGLAGPAGRRDRWWRRRQHRVGLVSGATLAAGIAAGIVSGLLQGRRRLGGPLVTAWQPARALARRRDRPHGAGRRLAAGQLPGR